MKKNWSTYYWCKICGYNNKGYWVNMHKPEDCYRAKKSEDKSGKDIEEVEEGNIALEMVERGFLAIL